MSETRTHVDRLAMAVAMAVLAVVVGPIIIYAIEDTAWREDRPLWVTYVVMTVAYYLALTLLAVRTLALV